MGGVLFWRLARPSCSFGPFSRLVWGNSLGFQEGDISAFPFDFAFFAPSPADFPKSRQALRMRCFTQSCRRFCGWPYAIFSVVEVFPFLANKRCASHYSNSQYGQNKADLSPAACP